MRRGASFLLCTHYTNVSTLMFMSFYSTCTFLTDMALVTRTIKTILKPDTALLDAGTQETTTVSYDML